MQFIRDIFDHRVIPRLQSVRDFRVRYLDGHARLQVTPDQLGTVMEHREEILRELKKYYRSVMLDLETRQGA